MKQRQLQRCEWVGSDPLMTAYHDMEWGVPCHDDSMLFEYIVLDTFQAGLSWSLMIKKRENFRKAFAGFDPEKVARFTQAKVEKLMNDSGIIRNRLKIEGTIANAQAFLRIQKEFGSFEKYLWSFVNNKTIKNKWGITNHIPAVSSEAQALSKDMKNKGFKFCGPTVTYAFMQGAGLVNDHLVNCFRYKEVGRK